MLNPQPFYYQYLKLQNAGKNQKPLIYFEPEKLFYFLFRKKGIENFNLINMRLRGRNFYSELV